MRVKAIKPCFVKHYREEGDEFEIDPKQFSKNCMEKVEDESSQVASKKLGKKEEGSKSPKKDEDVI
jgi:hypothetical protein